MHYMVPLFLYTYNFVIQEVFHYIKELYKFSHEWIKNTLHSFSHGLINFRECPTRETSGELTIILEESIQEYTSNEVSKNRKMSNT